MQTANYNYSVYGDSNITRATINTNLNSIPDQGVTVKSDLNDLNVWQGINLNDLFYTRQFVQQQAFSITNDDTVEFDFTLPGFVHMKQIGIDFQLLLKYFTIFKASSKPQGSFTFMDVIKNIEIRIGNNSFRPSTVDMEQIMGMKVHAQRKIRNLEESKAVASWGNLYSNGVIFDKTEVGESPIYKFTNANGIDGIKDFYDRIHTDCRQYLNGAPAATQEYVGLTPVNMYLGLNEICPFFNQNSYLPSGTPINIKIFANRLQSGKYQFVSGRDNLIDGDIISEINQPMINMSKTMLSFFYYIVKDDARTNFDNMWLSRPLMYNYFYWRVQELKLDSINTIYTMYLEPGTQVPLELIFVVKKKYDTNNVASLLDGFANFNNSNACGYKFEYIRIKENGREREKFEPLSQTQYPMNETYSQTTINNIANAKVNNDVYPWNTALSSMTGGMQSIPFSVVLSPDKYYNQGVYPTDYGASNLTIEFKISTIKTNVALSSDYSIQVYKIYPGQASLNSSYRFIQAEWPVVMTTSGPKITETFNTN